MLLKKKIKKRGRKSALVELTKREIHAEYRFVPRNVLIISQM